MYLTASSILRGLSKEEHAMLKEMCECSNNLYNYVLYHERQKFFEENKVAGFYENCKLHKVNENFKMLNSGIAQQTMKVIEQDFKSFFALLKKKKNEGYDSKVRLPHYKEKGGVYNLIIVNNNLPKIKNGYFPMPMSKEFKKLHNNEKIMIPVPEKLWNRKINQIIIYPLHKGKKFKVEFQYETELDLKEVDKDKVLAIDIGLDNLATCVTNSGESFIIDGRKIKSINQYWNKRNAKYQGIADKQEIGRTRFLDNITMKRNNQVKDYIHKTARYIVNYCIEHKIGTIICGYNEDFKRGINLGRKTNQKFVQIPFCKLKDYLKYKCELHGIDYMEQEESYTSKASFFDLDNIPVYEEGVHHNGEFSGQRIYRGLYRSSDKTVINADVNGAANILRKSKHDFDFEKMCRGLKASPMRIRLS